MRRVGIVLLIVTALVATATAPVQASQPQFPPVIELPNGFFPEGIAIGERATFYTGSLVDGAIYRGSVRTGEGEVLVPGQPGLLAVGMDVQRRSGQLWVAGGSAGTVRVYDGDTGSLEADIPLGPGFINDVITTRLAAYVTNSFAPEIYEIPLDRRGSIAGPPRVIPLSGDFQFVPGEFNTNGIVSANRNTVIVVNSFTGVLFRVDVATGEASAIDTGGAVVNGDGLVLVGRTLYAVVGSLDQVTKLRLSKSLSSARVTETFTDDGFDVPTTAAVRGSQIYVVSARFGTPPTPATEYSVVAKSR